LTFPRFRLDWAAVRLAGLSVGSVVFIYLTVVMSVSASGGIIGNDLSGYLAPVVAMVRGNGAPYVDYFDIKPPGLTFFLLPWVAIFGSSMPSLIVLDVILLAGTLALFWYVLRLVASPVVADVVYALALVGAFGLRIFGMFLMSETVGSLFFLLAIALAIRFREDPRVFFAVGALCAFCSQVKEVWVFAVLPLAFFGYVATKRWRTLVFTAAGFVAMIGLLGLSLAAVGALGAYLDVLRYKSEAFPLPLSVSGAKELLRVTFYESFNLWLLWWPAFVVAVGLGYLARGRVLGWWEAARELVGYRQLAGLLTFLLLGAMVAGFAWQAKRVSGHNYAMLLFPLMLLTAAGLSYSVESVGPAIRDARNGRLARFVLAGLLIACLVPSVGVVKGLNEDVRILGHTDQVGTLTALESPAALSKFEYISAHVGPGGCVQVAYGWRARRDLHLYPNEPLLALSLLEPAD
jgi:hypothetical protein